MWFDNKAHKPKNADQGQTPATTATTATQTPKTNPRVAEVASVAGGQGGNQKTAAPDADGVARTPEAIEAVWSGAIRRAVEIRKTMKPPTCARCGQSDWRVSVTEINGRKLHVACWQAETREADRRRHAK